MLPSTIPEEDILLAVDRVDEVVKATTEAIDTIQDILDLLKQLQESWAQLAAKL